MLHSADTLGLFREFFERVTPFGLPWIDSRVEEARSILGKRSAEERETLQNLALWLLDGAPDDKTDVPQVDFSALSGARHLLSPAGRLHHCEEQLGDAPTVGKSLAPSWDEVYAALALRLFLYAYAAGDFAPGGADDAENEMFSPEFNYGESFTSAAQAVEALAYGHLGKIVAREVTRRRKIVASVGGLARSAKTRPFRDAVLAQYWSNYPKDSARQAAKKIIKDLQREGALTLEGKDGLRILFRGIEVLRNQDLQKQIEKWIGNSKQQAVKD